jgi:hypothetical protein
MDFTLWVRDCIQVGDSQSVLHLLQRLSRRAEVVDTLAKMASLFDLSPYLAAEETLINELMAIYLLGYRTRYHTSDRGHLYLMASLVEVTISLYSFRLWDEKLAELAGKLRNAKRSGEIEEIPPMGALRDVPRLSAETLHRLRQLPPTCRVVLADAARRAQAPSQVTRLNLSADYGLRMYGCNESQNGEWIASLGWNAPLFLDVDISRYVDKPGLHAALGAHGMTFKRSATKSELLEAVRSNADCWTSICQGLNGQVAVFRPEVFNELHQWTDSISGLRWPALAIAAV